jgi:hypothetical protein
MSAASAAAVSGPTGPPVVGVPVAPPLPADLEALLRRLRLPHVRRHAPDVLAAAKAQRWDPAEVLRVLLAEEVAGRDRSALATRRSAAAFPTGKTFAAWQAEASSVPAATQQALRTLEWVGRRENLVVCGPSGTGKTFLLEALGQAAVERGLHVAWFTLENLGVLVRRHRADDTVTKAISRVLRADLVVIDLCRGRDYAEGAAGLPGRRHPGDPGLGIITGLRGREQLVRRPVATGPGRHGGREGQRLLLDADVGVEVGVCGPDAGVAEPEGDHGGVDAGVQQGHGAAVAQDVRMDALAQQRRAVLPGGLGVGADAQRDGVAAEPPSGAGWEQRVARLSGALSEPDLQQRRDRAGERDDPLLAALALAGDAGAGAERDVAAVQADELGDPQAGLNGQQQQNPVSSSFPSGLVRSGDQGVDLDGGQERHDPLVEPLRRDGQDALDEQGVLGVTQRGVAEQRPDGGQPGVAGPDAVVPLGFKVVQKGCDRGGVQVVQSSRQGGLPFWRCRKASSSRRVSR